MNIAVLNTQIPFIKGGAEILAEDLADAAEVARRMLDPLAGEPRRLEREPRRLDPRGAEHAGQTRVDHTRDRADDLVDLLDRCHAQPVDPRRFEASSLQPALNSCDP